MAGSVAGIIATLIMAGGATALRMGTQGSPGMAAKVAMAASPGMVVAAGMAGAGAPRYRWGRHPGGPGRPGAPTPTVGGPTHPGAGSPSFRKPRVSQNAP